jgi:hypothetical protein
MEQRIPPRIWSLLGVGAAALVGLALLLIALNWPTSTPTPRIHSEIPTPAENPIAVSVNGYPIRRDFWDESFLLDQVLSELAGQPVPTPEETLQRLVNEELVLRTVTGGAVPTTQQVEAQIAALQETWNVEGAAVVAALERAGLSRVVFERMVWRLLAVQAALDTLQAQGHDVNTWLEQQRTTAEIVISAGIELPSPAQPHAVVPPPTQTPPSISPPTPIPTMASSLSAPTGPEQAVDFSLRRADGSVFTLTEQLTHGPVVLVFFQRCG